MKNLIFFSIALLLLFGSCSNDEDKKKPVAPIEYPIYKNSHRVTKISGKNGYWGDYKLLFSYNGEKLANAALENNQGDTVGYITTQRSSVSLEVKFSVGDIIPSISQDSIDRMDIQLALKYGVGNYSLKDSIPRSFNALETHTLIPFQDGRPYKQIDEYFIPRENVGITGVDFNNNYILIRKVYNFYEYNTDGYITVNRMYDDEYYDKENPELFRRKIFKDETYYDKDRVVGLTHFEALSGENFSEVESYNFDYSGNKLVAVKGSKSYTKTITYSGNYISLITDGTDQFNYEFNSFGYPSKITDGKGNVMEIEYEVGHGDVSQAFTSIFARQMGNPYVK